MIVKLQYILCTIRIKILFLKILFRLMKKLDCKPQDVLLEIFSEGYLIFSMFQVKR